MTDILFLIGPSGSGKSTLAREKHPDRILIEADQFYEILLGRPGQGYSQAEIESAGMVNEKGFLKPECFKSAHRFVIETTTCALRLNRRVVLCGAWTRKERLLDIVQKVERFLERKVSWRGVILETRFKSAHGVSMPDWRFDGDLDD